MHVDHPIISADSHITEARNTYTDYIDPAYRDTIGWSLLPFTSET